MIAAVALVLLAAGAWVVYLAQFEARGRSRARQDVERAIIEAIEIDGAVPVSIPASNSSVDPAFAFELSGPRTLVLLGQWLEDPCTFGGDWASLGDADEADEIANTLPKPYSFPTTAFTLHRFPVSGEVLRIEIRGDYVAPTSHDAGIELTSVNDSDSHLFDCSLDELAARLSARPMP